MFRSILVAVHRSPAAGPAMALAARLARQTGAQLKALYVEDPGRFVYVPLLTAAASPLIGEPPMPRPLPPDELLAVEQSIEEEERDLRESFVSVCRTEGLAGQFQVVCGSIEDTLLERSRTVDLLVMGSGQVAGAGGSLAEGLLRESARPILVACGDTRSEGPALFAYDGSRPAQRALAVGAALLATGAFRCVQVLTAGEDTDEAGSYQAEAREYLAPYAAVVEPLVHVGDAAESIVSAARGGKAAIIVMGAFGDSPVSELIFGSTTRDVLAEAPCPVLCVS
jgi:nucleotide-binding universal stress UspA family protein